MDEEKITTKSRPVVDDDMFAGIPKVYANAVKVSQSLFDIQMVFSTMAINDFAEEPKIMIEPKFITYLSPQHFKVLVKIMSNLLDKYEQKFGTIPLPPEEKHDE